MLRRVVLFGILAALFVVPIISTPANAHHGDTLVPMLWEEVREEYPILSPVRIGDDFPTGFAAATYGGFSPDGYHRVSFSVSVSPTTDLVWHEAGHAYSDLLGHKGYSADELFSAFWIARGFPGTWQMAQYNALEARRHGLTDFAVWRLLPNEMWAEAFKASNLGTYERTENYGVPLNHVIMRSFFKWLMWEPFQRYVSEPFPALTDSRGNADLTVPIYGLVAYRPTVVLVQRVGTTGVERVVPGLLGQTADAVAATVRVRGDFIKNGTIWLQIVAMQGDSISAPFPVWVDANGNGDSYHLPLRGTVAGRPTTVIVQRVGTTGVERVVPGMLGQSTDGVSATVRVRGDYIRNGYIWLQLVAIQRYGSYPFSLKTDANGDVDWPYMYILRIPGRPTFVYVQRVGTTGAESVVPGLLGQWGNDGQTTIRVRGDYIKNGTIWLQYVAIQ